MHFWDVASQGAGLCEDSLALGAFVGFLLLGLFDEIDSVALDHPRLELLQLLVLHFYDFREAFSIEISRSRVVNNWNFVFEDTFVSRCIERPEYLKALSLQVLLQLFEGLDASFDDSLLRNHNIFATMLLFSLSACIFSLFFLFLLLFFFAFLL